MSSKVMELIYWKDVERTGMVFTGLVMILLALFQLSLVSVLSTVSLVAVCCGICVRLYYKLLSALQWADATHPFQSYLDKDIALGGEETDQLMRSFIVQIGFVMETLKRLLFVGSLFNSLKVLLLMYVVSLLGPKCSGLTLLIAGVISLFSVPLFYKQHQAKVDGMFAAVHANIDNIKDILHRLAQGAGPAADHPPEAPNQKASERRSQRERGGATDCHSDVLISSLCSVPLREGLLRQSVCLLG